MSGVAAVTTTAIDDVDEDRIVQDRAELQSDRVQAFIEDAEAALASDQVLRLTVSLVRPDRTERQIARYEPENGATVREWIWDVLDDHGSDDDVVTLRLRLWGPKGKAQGGVNFRVGYAPNAGNPRPARANAPVATDTPATEPQYEGCDHLATRVATIEDELERLRSSLDDAWAAMRRAAEQRNEQLAQRAAAEAENRKTATAAARTTRSLETRLARLEGAQATTSQALADLTELLTRR
jgi:hypothetical protein